VQLLYIETINIAICERYNYAHRHVYTCPNKELGIRTGYLCTQCESVKLLSLQDERYTHKEKKLNI